jgi:hypothetical protein
MPLAVRMRGFCLHERDELVAHVDECLTRAASALFEREYLPVKSQGCLDVTGLKRNTVDADELGLLSLP